MLIAHLSDPHLRGQGQLYQDLVDSNAMFVEALRHLETLRPQPDLVIMSGDIVDTADGDEYEVAKAMLAQIKRPLLVIPGNHDEPAGFRACFANHLHLPLSGPLHFAVGKHGPVRVLGLDVTVPGAHHGDMDDGCCQWLEDRLAEEPHRPTVIMMHQPPLESGIPFIDKYHCRCGERMAAIVARFPSVERILCGHIHRFMQARFGGTMLVTAPSTTTAIALRLSDGAEPASFVEPPALLLHHWRPRSGLVTHYVPIGSFRGPLPFF